MTRSRKISIWVIAAVAAAALITIWLRRPRGPKIRPINLTGVVLIDDSDPRKQLPVADAEIIATAGLSSADGKSDSSGLFRVTLRPGVEPGQKVKINVRHTAYEPLEMTEAPGDRLFIARLKPLPRKPAPKVNHAEIAIKDVRLRYSVKLTNTVNVGSAAQPFEIVNTGNVPCHDKGPCSPDGKWKAVISPISLDAGEGNEFRNVRLSCIAGPCPFSRVESENIAQPGRYFKASIRNWSDTVTYLVEAEVARTMVNDMVRQSYPVKFGQAMDFTLPANAEGPAIEAELDGTDIVFPLGPEILLSWASCRAEVAPDHSRLYQCELKPGYKFE
jgi:hypothetical protein